VSRALLLCWVCSAPRIHFQQRHPGSTFSALQEYCNGGTLRQAVEAGLFERGSARTSRWQSIVATLTGVAEGMQHMHDQRCCHGDLNPANILFKVRLCPILCMCWIWIDDMALYIWTAYALAA
jgi:serine/threonine protein kinase